MTIDEWKMKNDYIKRYAHFDRRVKLTDVWDEVNSPAFVKTHGFFPFIHYTKKNKKFNKKEGIKIKERDICYAAHIDRCIYQLYAYKLNNKYNERVIQDNTTNCAVAYRTDLGKSNIHFAKEAFDFILSQKSCYIIVGDFTNFFESIDHLFLKKQLMSLLNVKCLPEDYYAVYKNITKYSKWELTDLLSLNSLSDTPLGIIELNKKDRVVPLDIFKKNKKKSIISNPNHYGIPQGSPISAVLSNIYMLTFDKCVQNLVSASRGKYLRYSDDFIIIVRADEEKILTLYNEFIMIIEKIPNLELQKDKTKVFKYVSNSIVNVNSTFLDNVGESSNSIDYLGFTFNGKDVCIRDKTLTKFHYRLERKANDYKRQVKRGNYRQATSAKKSLYRKHSLKGKNIGRGNFLSYVDRASNVFGGIESIQNGTKRHMGKIKRLLK